MQQWKNHVRCRAGNSWLFLDHGYTKPAAMAPTAHVQQDSPPHPPVLTGGAQSSALGTANTTPPKRYKQSLSQSA